MKLALGKITQFLRSVKTTVTLAELFGNVLYGSAEHASVIR